MLARGQVSTLKVTTDLRIEKGIPMIEAIMEKLRWHKVYCELSYNSTIRPSPLMRVQEKDIYAFWILQVMAVPPISPRDRIVEIAEGDGKGKVYLAEIFTLRRLIQPYIIELKEEVLVKKPD